MIAEKNQVFTKFIDKLELEPQAQTRVSLGRFTSSNPAKGFSVEVSDDEAKDDVVTLISMLKKGRQYEVVLHATNYGSKKTDLTVWSL